MLTVRIHQPAADNVLKWRRCFSCGSDAIWRTATLGNIRAMTGANELENFQFSFFKDFSRSVEQYFFILLFFPCVCTQGGHCKRCRTCTVVVVVYSHHVLCSLSVCVLEQVS